MSEQNILNPAVDHELNPNYGPAPALPEMFARAQARSGKPYARRLIERGHVIECAWNNRPMATYMKFKQWAHQYENGFFTYVDWETGRYYTVQVRGSIMDPQRAGHNKYSWKATLEEIPGLPMYEYPSNWERDGVFIEERDDFGRDTAMIVGFGWGYQAGQGHGPTAGEYVTGSLDNYVAVEYFGYGFQVWSRKAPNAGNLEISLDGGAAVTVDLYAAAGVPSAPVYSAQAPLSRHTVKLRCPFTKNPASSAYYIIWDALRVIR